MNKALFTVFAAVLSTFCISAQITHSAYVPANYQLVFNDEFNDPSTKLVNWKPDNRDGRGDEWLSSFGAIESGCMKLKNVKLPTPTESGRAFTAPTCSSVRMFKYGYFECRYKYAASTGFNNSFWLLNPGSQLGKDYIEIDINEGQMDEGGKRNMDSYLAAGAQPSWDQVRPLTLNHTRGGISKAAYKYYNIDLSADFHTYGFLWTPDSLSYFFDGVKILTHANKRIYNDEPVYRLLNYPMSVYLSVMNDASIPGFDKAVASSMDVDYVRVYQLPGSTDGLPPTTGDNLLKNGGFGNYDDNDYGSNMYSWGVSMGSVDSSFYSLNLSTLRTSPAYMPSQNINVLSAGVYELRFKARVIDATANTASIRMKISNSDNISTSSLTALVPYDGSGGVSGTEVLITKAHAPVMKTFIYRMRVGEPTANAQYTRVMFYMINNEAGATFQLDDIELKKIEATQETHILKDETFDLIFKDNYAPTDLDPGWSAYTNYSSGKFISSKVTESGNTFGRLQTTVTNGEDYHYALAQYTNKPIAAGKYKITLRAKANADSKKIALRIGTVSAVGTNLPVNLTNATSGVTLASNKLYFWPTTSWQTYSGVFDLNHAQADLLRINFLFPDVGVFDIDDVVFEPFSITNNLSANALNFNIYSKNNTIVIDGDTQDMTISVYSVTGAVVKQLPANQLQNTTFRSGLYLVKLTKNKTVVYSGKVSVRS